MVNCYRDYFLVNVIKQHVQPLLVLYLHVFACVQVRAYWLRMCVAQSIRMLNIPMEFPTLESVPKSQSAQSEQTSHAGLYLLRIIRKVGDLKIKGLTLATDASELALGPYKSAGGAREDAL